MSSPGHLAGCDYPERACSCHVWPRVALPAGAEVGCAQCAELRAAIASATSDARAARAEAQAARAKADQESDARQAQMLIVEVAAQAYEAAVHRAEYTGERMPEEMRKVGEALRVASGAGS